MSSTVKRMVTSQSVGLTQHCRSRGNSSFRSVSIDVNFAEFEGVGSKQFLFSVGFSPVTSLRLEAFSIRVIWESSPKVEITCQQ